MPLDPMPYGQRIYPLADRPYTPTAQLFRGVRPSTPLISPTTCDPIAEYAVSICCVSLSVSQSRPASTLAVEGATSIATALDEETAGC